MSILKYLGLKTVAAPRTGPEAGLADAVREIVRKLDHLPPEQAAYIARFAYILSRVANADLNISEAETRAMERIVHQVGGLPEEQAVLVVHLAKSRNLLFGGTDNFLVTREFNKVATREQKLALLDCLFAVAAAEEGVSGAEDAEIRQIADELMLEHRDYIAIRLRYRDELSVLKNLPGAGPRSPENKG